MGHPDLACPGGWAANATWTTWHLWWTSTKNNAPPQISLFQITSFCASSFLVIHTQAPFVKNTRFSFCILLLKCIVLPTPPHNKNLTQMPHPFPSCSLLALHKCSRILCPLAVLECVHWVAMWKPPREKMVGGEGAPRGTYWSALATCS